MDISARVHGNIRLPIGAILSLLPVVAYSKARVTTVSGGSGAPVPGPWMLDGTSNGTLTIGPFTDPTVLNVETLDGDVGVDITREWMHPESLGGDASVANLEAFSLASQIHKAGYTVLWMSASAGGARCNNLYGISDSATYSRTAGVVRFLCHAFPDADVGRYIKVAAPKRADLTALLQVISATDAGGGLTEIHATELYATVPRRDVALGSVTGANGDGSMVCHDMQSCTNSHSQIAKLNAMCGGVLDVSCNMGIGGATTTTWQNPDLRAYVEGMGYFDFVVFDFGYGNDTTAPTSSVATIFGRLDDCISWGERRGRQAIFAGAPGARLGGDGNPLPNPQLTVDFTTLQVMNHYMRSFLATRHKTVTYADAESRFMRAAMFGSVNTDDIVRGEPPQQFFEDGGIHSTPTGSDEIAADLGEIFLPLVKRYQPFGNSHTDFVFSNTTPEIGGLKNPNVLYAWHGATPTTPVVFSDYIVGVGIEGTTCDGSGFSGTSMEGTLSVRNHWRGGRGMRMHFSDTRDPSDENPSDENPNPTMRLYYRGTTAFPIIQALNDPLVQAGDVDMFADIAAWGWNQSAVFEINVAMVGVSGGVARKIASWYCDDGISTMTEAHRGWIRGFNGNHRAGCGRCRVPPNVFTDAYFLFEVIGTPIPGFPIGDLYFDVNEIQIRRRQVIA